MLRVVRDLSQDPVFLLVTYWAEGIVHYLFDSHRIHKTSDQRENSTRYPSRTLWSKRDRVTVLAVENWSNARVSQSENCLEKNVMHN